jgi:hypothetical protein
MFWHRADRLPNNHTRLVLASLLLFVVLAVVHTWPLAQAPAHWSRVDPGDGALNTWIVGWVAHSLATDPARLFEANIFYPEHRTLAYSEAMLVQGVLASPVMAFGGSAVLAYNIALLAGLTLTGWAFCLLVRRWTASWSAGLVAGSLAAFNAHTLTHFTHLQFQHTEFFAVMLYGLDRLIITGRMRYVWTLAGGFALQGLTSVYLLVFAVWSLLFAIAVRAKEWWTNGKMLSRMAAAGVLAMLMLSPYLAQYVIVQQTMGFTRTAEDEAAAHWANYLSTGARLHFNAWSRPFFEMSTSSTFPGLAALALVLVAISDPRNTSDARFRMCAVVGGGCAAVSLAPRLPFYAVLHAAIPLFQAVRVIAHLGQVVLLMVAVIAGFGVASLQESWQQRRAWPLVAILLVVLVNAEALRAPIAYTWFERIPAVYDELKKEPGAVVLELPFPLPQQWFMNTPYMVNSTGHWRPLINGYSGFRPPSYYKAYEATPSFPLTTHAITSRPAIQD